jgi:hypothetical protein
VTDLTHKPVWQPLFPSTLQYSTLIPGIVNQPTSNFATIVLVTLKGRKPKVPHHLKLLHARKLPNRPNQRIIIRRIHDEARAAPHLRAVYLDWHWALDYDVLSRRLARKRGRCRHDQFTARQFTSLNNTVNFDEGDRGRRYPIC